VLLLEADDKPQDGFPLRLDEPPVQGFAQPQGVGRQVGYLHVGEGLELLVLKGLDARGESYFNQKTCSRIRNS